MIEDLKEVREAFKNSLRYDTIGVGVLRVDSKTFKKALVKLDAIIERLEKGDMNRYIDCSINTIKGNKDD